MLIIRHKAATFLCNVGLPSWVTVQAMYTKGPLIRKQHLRVRVKDACCNVWRVLIFFLGIATICNIIYLIRPSLSLSGALYFVQYVSLPFVTAQCSTGRKPLSWPQRKLKVPSPHCLLEFSEGCCGHRAFCSQSAGCSHVMENHV